MKHVFVETNWVVAWAAPAHHRDPAAVELLARAQRRELKLYLPSICLTEARRPLSAKFRPSEVSSLREFLLWAKHHRPGLAPHIDATRHVLADYKNAVESELSATPAKLNALREQPGLEVFALDHEMHERAIELAMMEVHLEPFDQAILAAVLVRAERLCAAGETDLAFCEQDPDLQPWKGSEITRQLLTNLYDDARIWVYGDFALKTPEQYEGWPAP